MGILKHLLPKPDLMVLAALVLVCAACSGPAVPQAGEPAPSADIRSGVRMDKVVKPFAKPDGRPFRIGVIQSGDYYFYNEVLQSIHDGLANLEWAPFIPLGVNSDEPDSIALMLQAWNKTSSYLDFSSEYLINLKYEETPEVPPAVISMLSGKDGVDLVISLGTLAGTLVAQVSKQGLLAVPVLIESVSDPLGSQIITSYSDSGSPFISASCDPGAYDRQIRLFHKVMGFKRLGLIYTDTETGRSYVAFDDVSRASRETGFDIASFTDVLEDPQEEPYISQAAQKYLEGISTLAPKVDAFYLGIQGGLTTDSLPAILDVTNQYKLPVFAMEGVEFVKRGALMGESSSSQNVEGLYSARKITLILSGEKAGSLPQINSHVPLFALNLAAAKIINYDFPVDILLATDEVYTSIQRDTPAEVQP